MPAPSKPRSPRAAPSSASSPATRNCSVSTSASAAKTKPTDVLSFPTVEPNGPVGSIAISLRRAAAQAREFGHSIEAEVRILMLHGLLHLTGLDHETDNGRMARAEKRWRSVLALPNGLIERVHERVQS